MKKALIISMLALFSGGAMAQDLVEFGVKAGVNTTNFDIGRKTKLNQNIRAFSDARTGCHAGVFMRMNLPTVYVQPEFLYNWNSYDLVTMAAASNAIDEQTSKIKVQTLEVPVLVGWKILLLRVNAGPVFNIMNKTSHSGGLVQRADVIKPSVSYSAGFGLDMFGGCIDIRYNGLFEKAKQTIEIGGESHRLDTNFKGWTFALGYRF